MTGKENKITMPPLGKADDFNIFEVMEPNNLNWMDTCLKKEKG